MSAQKFPDYFKGPARLVEIDRICHKMRVTIKEFGNHELENAVVISPYDLGTHVSSMPHVYSPTAADITLGGVDYKVARFFEDVDVDMEEDA